MSGDRKDEELKPVNAAQLLMLASVTEHREEVSHLFTVTPQTGSN